MSSVSPPNKSDTGRSAATSEVEHLGGDTEGTVDRLNETPTFYRCYESNREVNSVIYDCVGNPLTHGQIVDLLNDWYNELCLRRLPQS